jgi:hypothetical protein
MPVPFAFPPGTAPPGLAAPESPGEGVRSDPRAGAALPFSPDGAVPPPAPLEHRPSGPRDAPRRPSGEFDPLEADFFAREADLYKTNEQEAFDDLDRRKPR